MMAYEGNLPSDLFDSADGDVPTVEDGRPRDENDEHEIARERRSNPIEHFRYDVPM